MKRNELTRERFERYISEPLGKAHARALKYLEALPEDPEAETLRDLLHALSGALCGALRLADCVRMLAPDPAEAGRP